jgi:5-formaminoimidazole-4-carboxamide-1-(beta)-D-ribofuranosyl 5'-monophosphate synthetase
VITKEKIESILADYKKDRIKIATICSHSALQIFHGARQEGFKTMGIVSPDRREVYEAFPRARPDEFLEISAMKDLLNPELQQKLVDENVIVVPHGSFVEYIGPKNLLDHFAVPMLGNRAVLEWESNREKQREWLKKAGLKVPPRFKDPSMIDRPVLVKLSGAKGGKGFFVAFNEAEFRRKIGNNEDYIIQEFVIGPRYYLHYFFSPLFNDGCQVDGGRLELLSMDRRVESNIDELHRFGFTREEIEKAGIQKSFVVTGNEPLILRESLLPSALKMGKGTISASMDLFRPGMLGPFCLETIVTPDLEFYVFEISARIVAGTNLFPQGSPYSALMYDQPMSTGRRIAHEVKEAARLGELSKVVY